MFLFGFFLFCFVFFKSVDVAHVPAVLRVGLLVVCGFVLFFSLINGCCTHSH